VTCSLAGSRHVGAEHPAGAGNQQLQRIEMSELSPTMKR
jgi:hypothetical protein